MQYIIYILFAILIYIAWHSFKLLDKKINLVNKHHSALFWALKKKGLIDINEYKEGQKMASGKKMPLMRIKDFMDLNKE